MGELIIILLIVLVVFGASKLPQIGDALGRSIKNFKRATKGDEDDEKGGEIEEKEKQKQPMQIGTKAQKQLEPAGDDDGEWEEVVVRRRKKSASSSES